MFEEYPKNSTALRDAITQAYRVDETVAVDALLDYVDFTSEQNQQIQSRAAVLVEKVRTSRKKEDGIEAFMKQYDLSSEEGIALMCVAEALLRIPDASTVNKLLQDKIGTADWVKHLGTSSSRFVNAATWSLMLTGKIISPSDENKSALSNAFKKIMSRSSEGVIRQAMRYVMKVLGSQFVMGRTIEEAIKRSKELEKKGYRYSYDMLGEAAYTEKDAKRYFDAYAHAIEMIGKHGDHNGPAYSPSVSVKLSALHARYEFAQRDRVMSELVPRLKALAVLAKQHEIRLTVDAEESYRLELSLDIIEQVFSDHALDGWSGLGLAVQAYQKRGFYVIDWCADLARRCGREINVRLVKGAYWDTEIKETQELGLASYPVFTRKNTTDVSYLACAKKLLSHQDVIYPMFATHNAHSLSAILAMVGEKTRFEFQCLHGMGLPLYNHIVGKENFDIPCRIYAPVGQHEDLLAYLVRRLLENGANTSFVNRIVDDNESIESIVEDPIARTRALSNKPHPHIPMPANLYGDTRLNSGGIDFTNIDDLKALGEAMTSFFEKAYHCVPTIPKVKLNEEKIPVVFPADTQKLIGSVMRATPEACEKAVAIAAEAQPAWDRKGIEHRAQCLEKIADLFEVNKPELMALICKDGGRNLPDALSEVREAIDFCRYYAEQARKTLMPVTLPGPTGESNRMYMHGRGVALCISPWNFPLAIFTGQIVAALVAGNSVIAKPSEQTPLIAMRAVELMHEAGIPAEVMQLVPGRGSVIGAKMVADERVKAVMMTGSTETAQTINQTLANRKGDIVPLIAETGGQNVMIVDSSALPEQVVADVLKSAFSSAGQRCSALRVLYLQEDIADGVIEMIKGAMAELKVGDPSLLSTDVGPVIDQPSLDTLQAHYKRMKQEATLLYQVPMGADTKHGTFFAPCAFELKSLSQLQREVFGPILHILRYKEKDLDKVLQTIVDTGYGLTFGLHSRVNHKVNYLEARVPVGNMYVNRNMIGAVVGVQPFGGQGLSGTGPKAGGPHYLSRLCVERTVSINTTASGGNATLLSLSEDD
ncbi:MAG: bifunctional proline dehydrogenase/L-glutamate gamma-semialdehyde dehydrogenase PutA [Gammaproteobacteria bacterium]